MSASELDLFAQRLVAPLSAGDSLGDATLVSISAELALQYEVGRAGRTARIEVVPKSGARAERVTTRHFAIGHRGGTMDPTEALELCRRLARYVEANEEATLAWVRANEVDAARIREVRTGRALVADDGDAPCYALSPYRGCTIGCTFCYAQSRLQPLRAMLGLPLAPWGSWVDAHVDMPEVLAAQLETLPCAPIKLCPIVADPYQAIERRLRITRRCLETIAASSRDWPVLVLTRAFEITDDIELIMSLPRAWVGVSLPTEDDDVRRHFEPRGASVQQRLEVLRSFAEVGVPTFAVVQPMLPGDVDALADALRIATAGVAIGTLEGEEQAGPSFASFAEARTDAWQRDHAARLRAALAERDIPVWTGELPPELMS